MLAQSTVINNKPKVEREVVSANKVMVIPFESRLYLSEIDYKINAETKLTAKEIKYKFRDGLNEQLALAFKSSKYAVTDLMEDTAKYKKEITSIYEHLNYEFQKTPNQENYQPPKKEKDKKVIEKGQLNVETNADDRFMNAKITNAKVIPLLTAVHKCKVFVFVNQLEILATGSKQLGEIGEGSTKRKIIIHYTVYSSDAKELNSGKAIEEFDETLNNPKKIIDKHFSKISQTICQRVTKALMK